MDLSIDDKVKALREEIRDFFAKHLLGVKPPEWKALEDAMKKTDSTTSLSR